MTAAGCVIVIASPLTGGGSRVPKYQRILVCGGSGHRLVHVREHCYEVSEGRLEEIEKSELTNAAGQLERRPPRNEKRFSGTPLESNAGFGR